MADDDDTDAWGDELEEKSSPTAGVSKDVLRKARAMNPSLAAQGSTTELFSKIKQGTEKKPAAGTPAASSGGGMFASQDFATAFYESQQKFKDEKKRIQEAMAKLQKELTELAPKQLEKVIDLIIAIDPNMMSPQTQEILKTEAAHLSELGFSIRRVIDRKMKKK